MNIIRLKGEVSFEQYQMAIRVLNAIGLEVKEEYFTENQMQKIKIGIAQADKGEMKSHSEVMKNLGRLIPF